MFTTALGDQFFPNAAPVDFDVIDDVVIGYEIVPIDGVSNQLGIAQPTNFEFNGAEEYRTIAAGMRLDLADFEDNRNNNADDDSVLVAIHEMGHALGVGPAWQLVCGVACRANGVFDYTCPRASSEYRALNLAAGTTEVLIENDTGGVRDCGHWEDASFPESNGFSEVMSAVLQSGVDQLLTTVSAGAIDDLGGYGTIDFTGADDPNNRNDEDPPLKPKRSFVLGTNSAGVTTITYLD